MIPERAVFIKSFRAALLIGLSVTLTGCYDFDFPLDAKPELAVDARFVGAWRCLGVRSDAEEPPFILRIAKKSERVADWSIESTAADGTKEIDRLEAYGSTVKDANLLNVLEKGEKANGKWNFVQFNFLMPDILRLQAIDDTSFKTEMKNAADLRKAVEKRRDDPSIYNAFAVCVRVKPADSDPLPSPSPKF